MVENLSKEDISLSLMTRRTPSATEGITPTAKGVNLSVYYTDLAGKKIAVDKLKQGEEFLAHIDVKKIAEASQSMALTYAVPSGWEIWNERLVGGVSYNNDSYTDIRDERVSWYFSLGAGEKKHFTVQLCAAYAGTFILPPTVCEDMYNATCRAMTANSRTSVE